MGGGGSAMRSLWSPEEELQFKKAKQIQKRAADYVVKYFFEGIPTRTNKHSQDPLSPVFVQPDDGNSLNRAKEGIDNQYFKLIPTTVMLGADGLIRVIFMTAEITYNLTLDEVEEATAQLSLSRTIRGPDPPKLHEAHRTSLDVYWGLPYPPGVSQALEVQYAIVYNRSSTTYKKRSERVFKSSRGGMFDGFYGSQWLNWTQRRWSENSFHTGSLFDLDPGTGYIFRMRYRSTVGWSEYSDPSPVFHTKPDVPSKPKPVVCVAKTPNSALLQWTTPACNNGAPILGYILEGRSVGDDFIELYNGPKISHIVFSLFPEFAYSFRVAAVNSEGMSLFSDMFSVQTPPRLQFRTGAAGGRAPSRDLLGNVPVQPSRNSGGSASEVAVAEAITPVMSGFEEALQCRQAWKECWDERSQGFFYFNMMTGTRQRERPEVWDQAVNLVHRPASMQLGLSVSEDEPEESDIVSPDDNNEALEKDITADEKERQEENDLRTKKFSLYTALQKARNRTTQTNSIAPNDRQKLSFRRNELLLDAFKYLMGSTPAILRAGRLQVDFDNEEGIDSGGLSKEFFLLVSKLVQVYSLQPSKQYILDVEGKVFFKNRMQRRAKSSSENIPSAGTERVSYEDDYILPDELPRANISVQILNTIDGDEEEATSRAEFFFFLGRFIGKALHDRQFVDFPLCPILWKHVLSVPVVGHNCPVPDHYQRELAISMEDLRLLDSSLSQSLLWMLNNSIDGILDETFSVQVDTSGDTVPLCKDGENIRVSDSNKKDYVDLIIKWRTEYCVKTEIDYFVRGFCEVVPRKAILESGLTITELALILNGKKRLDVEEIRAYTIYQSSKNDKANVVPFGEHTDHVSWLWMMLRKFDSISQGKLLLFVTGTSCVPLDGYDPPFNITDGEDMALDSLPKAHTCFNQIVLPLYSSYEVMRERVLFAINNTEGFALS